ASNPVGSYFQWYPESIEKVTGKWIKHKDFWLNRTALLFQLKYKDKTDFELLKSYIEKHKHQDEFFIRKAIGWALRQHAKYDPIAVKTYVKTASLKPLSTKEALKSL
ncbi:MAG: DNA alkylation repair protein, partial [Bacteroidia bacterium]|nr:DNA alkylation repair protein [Bacteroidia bacterium]